MVRIAAIELKFMIEASGLIAVTDSGEQDDEPALEITLAASSLAAALRGEESALKSAEIRGDAEFAAAIFFLVKNLRWDVEEDLSRAVGDIAAHRLMTGAKNMVAWERDARGRLAASMGEYLTQEGEILAAPMLVDNFVTEVDRLRDDAARLEKRLQGLAPPRNTRRKASPKP